MYVLSSSFSSFFPVLLLLTPCIRILNMIRAVKRLVVAAELFLTLLPTSPSSWKPSRYLAVHVTFHLSDSLQLWRRLRHTSPSPPYLHYSPHLTWFNSWNSQQVNNHPRSHLSQGLQSTHSSSPSLPLMSQLWSYPLLTVPGSLLHQQSPSLSSSSLHIALDHTPKGRYYLARFPPLSLPTFSSPLSYL